MKEGSMKKFIRNLLLVLCVGVFFFSLYKISTYYYEGYQSEKKFSQLESLVKDDNSRTMSFREKYAALLDKNSDMVGWITIPDTKINYPVMLTPNDEEYYLRRNFDKEYEFRGTPFINASANLEAEDDNTIIYAHNMDDGTMFGGLRKYYDYTFYVDHKTFQFDTIYRNATYEIVAVFKTVDDREHELYIDYYNFINARDEASFNQQIQMYKWASFYDTGVTPKYGDKLLTLSTCEYSNKNGRLVVVARKVEENEKN